MGYKVKRTFPMVEIAKDLKWKLRNWGTADLNTNTIQRIRVALANNILESVEKYISYFVDSYKTEPQATGKCFCRDACMVCFQEKELSGTRV